MIRPDLKAIPAYVAGARNDDALKLSSNEAAHPPLPEAAAAMAEAVTKANRYPDIAATALREEDEREPALVAFLVTASGVALLGIGAAFWGLVAGVLVRWFLHRPRTRPS